MKKNGFSTGLMYVLLVFLGVGLGFLIFLNFRANQQQQENMEAARLAEMVTPTPEPTMTPVPSAVPVRNAETVTLAFAGDLVGQAGLTTDAKTSGDDGTESYDFTQEIEGVRSSLENADLAACTLVSTLTESGDYDSYRMPAAAAAAMKDAGFDLVNAATDHILDRGLEGLSETVGVLRNAGLGVLGAYDSSDRSLLMADVNGVKVGFLSYTYSTASNTGGAQPVSIADSSWCLDLLTTDYMTSMETVDYTKIDADIAAIREAGADIVVCFTYWWNNTQYYTEPRDNQIEVADHLLQSGVDILIGGGVKSPQPIEIRTVARPDGNANCVVCYSLSNLMSCFTDTYTNISAVAQIEISRDTDNGDIWISGVRACPMFMDYADGAEVGSRYRLLDAQAAVDAGQATEAVQTGMNDLRTLMGDEYFREGGMVLEFPYEAADAEPSPEALSEEAAMILKEQ